jgi:signal transduction histidine kinase
MQLKLASQPMFIHGDPGMVDQILLNLTVNARDAMPHGGLLVIATSGVEFDEFAAAQTTQARPGSFVCLSVSDSGTGIPPEIMSRIFEPFFTTKEVGWRPFSASCNSIRVGLTSIAKSGMAQRSAFTCLA